MALTGHRRRADSYDIERGRWSHWKSREERYGPQEHQDPPDDAIGQPLRPAARERAGARQRPDEREAASGGRAAGGVVGGAAGADADGPVPVRVPPPPRR